MTKLDILQVKVDKLYDELDSLDTRMNKLRFRRQKETVNIFTKYMDPDTEGIKMKDFTYRRMEFILLDDKYSSMTIERVNKEDLERLSWDDTLVDFKAYSNGLSLKNVEELKKRSELQVKLAEQFEDFKDDMIAEVNTMQEKYDGWIKELNKEYRELKDKVRPFSKELDDLKEKALEDKLLKGVTFKKEENRWGRASYPSVDVKWDWKMNNVKKLKVLRFSASRKSADLEITREWVDWDNKVTNTTEVVERVRVDNFKYTVKNNLKKTK